MPAQFPAIQAAVEEIESLMGSVFVWDGDEVTPGWKSLGTIGDISVNFKSKKGGADQAGRMKTLAFELEVNFVMLQTGDTAMQAAAALAAPTGAGHKIKITDELTPSVDDAEAANGVVFTNVLPDVGVAKEYRAGQSSIPVKLDGLATLAQFATFATSRELVLG